MCRGYYTHSSSGLDSGSTTGHLKGLNLDHIFNIGPDSLSFYLQSARLAP